MMKLKLPFTGTSRGRYAPVAMGMQPVGGVLASPSGMDDDDRYHDAQTPKRFTVLNRPSRTRSWMLVLFCVVLIGMGMVIWSGWQPLDWDFKKLRLPGFDSDGAALPGHPHAPPTSTKPVESMGGLDVVAPTGEDTAIDFSGSDAEATTGKAAHEYGYQGGSQKQTDHTDFDLEAEEHGDADMYGNMGGHSSAATTHPEVTDLYGDDGSHTSGSHADSDHYASEEQHDSTAASHEVTDLYGDDGTYSSGAHAAAQDEHNPLNPAVEPIEDEDEMSDETKYHLDHSGLPADADLVGGTSDATYDPAAEHTTYADTDADADADADGAYPTFHTADGTFTDPDADLEADHDVTHDITSTADTHAAAPRPGTVGVSMMDEDGEDHDYPASSHFGAMGAAHATGDDSEAETEEGEDRIDPNIDGLRASATADGFPEPEPGSRFSVRNIAGDVEGLVERGVKRATVWFA